MPTVFIHFGLAKTGTTAIQAALKSSGPALAESNLHVLNTGRYGSAAGHHCLAWRVRSVGEADFRCAKYSLNDTKEEIRRYTDHDVVISSEELSPLAYNYRHLGSLIDLFKDFRKVGIVYVREQVELFNSFFVELVKDLGTLESIGEFVQRVSVEPRYHYANWMTPWKERLDELIVRPYDRTALRRGDVVRDFFALLGRPQGLVLTDNIANETLSAAQVAAVQHASRRLAAGGVTKASVGPKEWVALKQRIVPIVARPPLADSGRYWGIPPRAAREIRKRFCESNAQFFQDFGDREFTYSACRSERPLNVCKYADLPQDIRRELQQLVDGEIATALTGPGNTATGAA